MKKLFFAAAAILLSTGAFAQSGIQWGVKAGLNLANVTNVTDSKFRPGLNAGVFGEYVINDLFGVQAELLYSMQGYKIDLLGENNTAKMDYINLPILAKLYVLEGLSVDLGPQFGYMISAKINDTDVYDDLDKKFDVSFGMGLTYKLNFGLDVFARYNLGLTKISNDNDDKTKNSVIQVGLGYRF